MFSESIELATSAAEFVTEQGEGSRVMEIWSVIVW